VLTALLFAGAFLFSVAVTGLFVWRGLDDLLAEVRPLRGHRLAGGAPCPRCRKRVAGGDGRCARCRISLSYLNLRVVALSQAYAIAEQMHFGDYIEMSINTSERQRISIVGPLGPVVRVGDELQLVFDGRHRLRQLHNMTLGTGWRLPGRIIGQRSPLAVIGLLFLVPVVTMLILIAPIYFLIQSLSHTYQLVSSVLASGVRHAPNPSFGSGEIAALLLYLLGLAVFGGLVMLARTRPRINRDIFR